MSAAQPLPTNSSSSAGRNRRDWNGDGDSVMTSTTLPFGLRLSPRFYRVQADSAWTSRRRLSCGKAVEQASVAQDIASGAGRQVGKLHELSQHALPLEAAL